MAVRDEERPRRERRSEERTMGRQRTAIDGYKENSTHSPSMAVCRGDLVETSQQFVLWLIQTERASLDLFYFKRTAGVVDVCLGLGSHYCVFTKQVP
jgi:hypothetical protein